MKNFNLASGAVIVAFLSIFLVIGYFLSLPTATTITEQGGTSPNETIVNHGGIEWKQVVPPELEYWKAEAKRQETNYNNMFETAMENKRLYQELVASSNNRTLRALEKYVLECNKPPLERYGFTDPDGDGVYSIPLNAVPSYDVIPVEVEPLGK